MSEITGETTAVAGETATIKSEDGFLYLLFSSVKDRVETLKASAVEGNVGMAKSFALIREGVSIMELISIANEGGNPNMDDADELLDLASSFITRASIEISRHLEDYYHVAAK